MPGAKLEDADEGVEWDYEVEIPHDVLEQSAIEAGCAAEVVTTLGNFLRVRANDDLHHVPESDLSLAEAVREQFESRPLYVKVESDGSDLRLSDYEFAAYVDPDGRIRLTENLRDAITVPPSAYTVDNLTVEMDESGAVDIKSRFNVEVNRRDIGLGATILSLIATLGLPQMTVMGESDGGVENRDALFGTMVDSVVGFGRGAPEVEDLGEIDRLAMEEIARTMRDILASNERLDEVEESKEFKKISSDNDVITTTGPVGSNLVAASMGYDPEDPTRYDGPLPYVFDLSDGGNRHDERLVSLRQDRANWPLTVTENARNPKHPPGDTLRPKPRDEEMAPGRPKYHNEYGMVVLKPFDTGNERYDKYDDLNWMKGDNLIIAGCHGEGTYAAAREILSEEGANEIRNHDNFDTGQQYFQVVFEAEISEYDERQSQRDEDTVYVPKFGEMFVVDVQMIDPNGAHTTNS